MEQLIEVRIDERQRQKDDKQIYSRIAVKGNELD